MFADMAKEAHAARLLDAGERATATASMARCFASDAAVARTADAVHIHGGMGHIRGVRVERLCRDEKIKQAAVGRNQIQRMIMPRALLA